MRLSKKANERVQYLTDGKNGEPKGQVAAVDPDTGEYFVGRTIAEAVREGRRRKQDPKATFFFVRIGSPAMHILKSVDVQGAVDEAMVPHLPAKLVGGKLLLAMRGEMLLGMEAMAQVAGSLVVQFQERTVALAD